MKKVLSLFLSAVLVLSMSVVAFADDTLPRAVAYPKINFDIPFVELNATSIDFLSRWSTSEFNGLVLDGAVDSPTSLTFVLFNVLPSFRCNTRDNRTYHIEAMSHNGYESLRFPIIENVLKTPEYKRETVSFVPFGIYYLKSDPYDCRSRYVSGSVFFNNAVSSTVKKGYGTYSGLDPMEVSFTDSSGALDEYASTYPILPVLTIRYRFADGSKAAPSFVEKYPLKASCDVPSPVVSGYTARIPVVSIPSIVKNTDVEVLYDLTEYNVLVKYQYRDGTEALPPARHVYHLGAAYSIASPPISGYTPDFAIVSDIITETSDTAIEHLVTYRDTSRKITVNYLYEDSKQAALPFTGYFGRGDSYEIVSPKLSGFVPSSSVVRGVLASDADANTVFDVVYRVSRTIVSADDFDLFTSGFLEVVGLITVASCTIFCALLSVKFIVKIIRVFIC